MSNLPENIAKECWLLEGVYYLGMGYVPYCIKYFYQNDVDDMDYRRNPDWYYDGDEIIEEIEEYVSDFMDFKFQMPNPMKAVFTHHEYRKYEIITWKHVDNVDKDSFHKETEQKISQIQFENEECLANYKENRQYEYKLIEEYRKVDERYYKKIYDLTNDSKHELYLMLRRGIIHIEGSPFAVEYQHKDKYPISNNVFIKENDTEYYDVFTNGFHRENIDYHLIDWELIKWENSALFTKDGRYYINVLISFQDLYKEKPQQLEYEITAKLLGNRIIYNGKTYQENTENSTKGRKPLEWDLFYAELIRYIIQNEKGVLPTKQEVTTTHMQNWCKNAGFSNGSRGSIQPKISAIYNAFQKSKNKSTKSLIQKL